MSKLEGRESRKEAELRRETEREGTEGEAKRKKPKGSKTRGKKHKASEKRAEILGRRESEETGSAQERSGAEHREAKAERCGEYGGRTERKKKAGR